MPVFARRGYFTRRLNSAADADFAAVSKAERSLDVERPPLSARPQETGRLRVASMS